MRILITCFCFIIGMLLSVNYLKGQGEYYSKVIRGHNDRTSFWDMVHLEESIDILITAMRNSTVVYVNVKNTFKNIHSKIAV